MLNSLSLKLETNGTPYRRRFLVPLGVRPGRNLISRDRPELCMISLSSLRPENSLGSGWISCPRGPGVLSLCKGSKRSRMV